MMGILLSPDERDKAIREYGCSQNQAYDNQYFTQNAGEFDAIAKAQAEKDAKENVDAITDYSEGKISLERLAERLGVSIYALKAAFDKYAKELK